MIDPKSVFILIPAFNEGKVIRKTIAPVLAQGYTIVLVDDCSSDNMFDAVKDLPIHYVRHSINLGQGAAIQTGIQYAYKNGAEYAVTFDADGQHNFEEIPKMLEPVIAGRTDITMGSRFMQGGIAEKIPGIRKLVIKTAIVVNGILTGLWLTDAHNGFRAMNRTALSKIKITQNRMAHATEILSLVKNAKLRYQEVPVHIVYTDYSLNKGQGNLNAINIVIDIIINKIF
ncbi:MAG: glycosyltransferase family 2 protein [Chitinophagales bacterium]|nr:glycosyltransferase family 2 protein [Chitinophagales bacterium]